MRNAALSLLFYGLCAPNVLAQEVTNEFNGKWNVSIQPGSGRPYAAKLVLTNFEGTWHDVAASSSGKGKVCGGKKFPVTVQKSEATELEFTAWGSSVSSVCPDVSITVRPVSAKVLEGTTAGGESIRMTRQ